MSEREKEFEALCREKGINNRWDRDLAWIVWQAARRSAPPSVPSELTEAAVPAVAWLIGPSGKNSGRATDDEDDAKSCADAGRTVTPLYAHPPSSPRHGMTEEVREALEFVKNYTGIQRYADTARCFEILAAEVRRLRQPVSDAEVSALEGRLAQAEADHWDALVDPVVRVAFDAIALLRRRTAGAWQPIESAPRDGKYFLAAKGNDVWIDFWMVSKEHTGLVHRVDATHWMPLPAPPAAGEKT